MLRRTVIGVVLAAFLVGLAGQASAETLPLIKHRTNIVITGVNETQAGFEVDGDLRSRYRPCTQRRLVGLFQNGEQVGPLVRSALDGTFTLIAPESGDYQIVAFKHARDCNHLCRISRLDISLSPVG